MKPTPCDRINERIRALDERLGSIDLPDRTTSQEEVHNGLIRRLFADVWDFEPLRGFLPRELGGSTPEIMGSLEVLSYHHLPLALAAGLNGVLFMLPLGRFGRPDVATRVLSRFRDESSPVLGGMMMTEPHCGTELFSCATRAVADGDRVRIEGVKQWAGLTGHADYWLVFARDDEAPRRGRYAFYLCDARNGFTVEEFFPAHGLLPIPYGRTRVDASVPREHRLGESDAYPSVVAGVLQGSRLMFAPVGHGFTRRVREEALRHTEERTSGGRPLSELDQVRMRLERIDLAELLTRAMCSYVRNDVRSLHDAPREARGCARIVKALATDLMFGAANDLSILRGSLGYREDSIGFSGVVDAYPFQIFEGPNDVLYDQVACDAIRAQAGRSLAEMLEERGYRPRQPDVRDLLDRSVCGLAQRGRVLVGRMLAFADAVGWMDSADDFSGREVEAAHRLVEIEMGRLGITLQLS